MTKEEALQIAIAYWPTGKVYEVYEELPSNCATYGLPREKCWYVLGQADKNDFSLRSSRLLCICCSDGAIIYDGDAGDEG